VTWVEKLVGYGTSKFFYRVYDTSTGNVHIVKDVKIFGPEAKETRLPFCLNEDDEEDSENTTSIRT
jgi:hypothetical protein